MNQPIEIDFSAQIKARYTVLCDGCQTEITQVQRYGNLPGSSCIEVYSREVDAQGNASSESLSFCCDECAAEYFTEDAAADNTGAS